MKILLPRATSATSPLSDMQVGISFNRNYNTINEFDVKETVNLYDVYKEERDKCTLYRLIVTFDPVCSNVLFNPITIILDNNNNRLEDIPITSGIPKKVGISDFNYVTDAIYNPSNNQTSNPNISSKKPYTYYCGYNVFDNHLFRTDLFKKADKLDSRVDEKAGNPHVYIMDDIKSFPSGIDNFLLEYNGWIGFKNPSKLITYNKLTKTKDTTSFPFLREKNNCDLIDMFPIREMFSFNPIINYAENLKKENNWNYILTYPYKSVYNHYLVQDTNTTNKILNGIPVLYINKLNVGHVNNTLSVPILQIQTAYNNSFNFGDNIEIENQQSKKAYKIVKVINNTTFFVKDDGVAISFFQKSRVRKLVNGIPSLYYIRKFRKLPNWKFESEEITPDNIDDKLKNNNVDFTSSLYGLSFAKNIYDDGLSQVIFTDSLDIKYLKDNLGRPLTEIYLTILKNNEKKSIYQKYWSNLSSGFELIDIDKNNLQFFENTNDRDNFINNYPSIFYIHNLKDNGTFTVSDSVNSNFNVVYPNTVSLPYNCHVMNVGETRFTFTNNVSTNTLLPINQQPTLIFPVSPKSLDDDLTSDEMCGDIVEFNKYTMDEVVLAPVMYRFNTTQRESFTDSDRVIKFHEIRQDDYDKKNLVDYDVLHGENFSNNNDYNCTDVENENYFIYRGQLNVGPRPEGYYYQAHNKIQLKNWSSRLNQASFGRIFVNNSGKETYGENKIEQLYFITVVEHRLINEDLVRIEIQDTNFDKIFTVRIDVKDKNKFLILYDDDLATITDFSKIHIRYFSREVPSFSKHIGSGRYVWKNILEDGEREDMNTDYVDHVFTNGHFYLNKQIKFYLRRQGVNLLYTPFPNDIYPETLKLSNYEYEKVNESC